MRNLPCTATGRRHRATVIAGALLAASLLAGCTSLFFFPTRNQVLSPQQLGLTASDITLYSADGTRLFAWHLQAAGPRGVVCFFHGNAENISTHILNVAWLPAAGYDVLLADYRGFGASAGEAEFPEALEDVQAALDWCFSAGERRGLPVFAFGQSLGAAMTLEVAAREKNRARLAAVVADSGFSHYRRIVRDVLAQSWLLAPLKYPLSWLVTRRHAPERAVAALDGLPLLVMHSVDDRIVPYAHAGRILAQAAPSACFLQTHGPHNAALNPGFAGSGTYQAAFLDFLAAVQAEGEFRCPPSLRTEFVAADEPPSP
jgi:alpha-beta hydrolase superfamily lysophospholipase